MRFFGRVRQILVTVLAGAALACSSDNRGATDAPPPGTSEQLTVLITPERDSVLLGTNRLFTARVSNQFGQARTASVIWRSTNSDVLSIDASGNATAIGMGSAQIIAALPTHADTAYVEVYGLAYGVHVVPEALALAVGDDVQLTASADNAGTAPTIWSITDTSVALVSDDGIITGVAAGSVEVTATVGTAAAKAKVDVFAVPIASVTVTPGTSSVPAGETVTLEAKAFTATGAVVRSNRFTWSSSDPATAAVNGNGRVTAKARGFVTILAEIDGKSATATVNVTPPPVSSVTTTLADSSLLQGQVVQAIATPLDAKGQPISGLTVGWQSSNPGVATVDASGKVTGIVAGTASVSAIVGGKIGTAPVTVSTTTPTELEIIPVAPSLPTGSSTQLVAEIHSASGTQKLSQNVVWSSSNSAVMTVSQSGVLTGVAPGKANITATSGTLSATALGTVTPVAVASITVSPTTASLTVGQNVALVANALDASGAPISGAAITWSSSAPGIAQVGSTGIVSALQAGSATITATSQGLSASATITVQSTSGPTVSRIDVTVNSSTLNVGQTTQALAVARDANGAPISGASMAWTSSVTSLATVSSTGLVTALAPGSVSIIATSGGVSGAAAVTIATPPPASVARVVLNLSRDSIGGGETSEAVVKLYDASNNLLTGRSVAFSSSKPTVASVSTSGMVTGVSAGTTVITASSEGQSATASLTVGSGTPVVASVKVNAPTSLTVGTATQATATAYDASGNPVSTTVTWASSNPTALQVSSVGMLTAVATGNATVSARTSSGVTGTLGITVAGGSTSPTVASVTVTLGSAVLNAGQTTQANVVLKDASGNPVTGQAINYSSSNTSVATVSTNGAVTALSTGSASISATSGGVSGSSGLTVQGSSTSNQQSRIATRPTLPQNFVDVSWKARTGATINVAAGGNLQQALNSAQPGDEIVLAAGATFTGNFTLPVKSGSGWILVRTSGTVPAQGQRLTRTTAGGVARIVTNSVLPAIQTAPGTRGWRFVGIEFAATTSVTAMTAIVSLGDGGSAQNTLAEVPRDLIFDRVWVHGHPTLNLRRCIALNSAATAVINSTIDECHDSGFDSQAIWGWNGPGPFLIENNYLEGSSENVGFGGGVPKIPNLVPTDIIIRRNHIAKPSTWKNAGWLVKNLIEFKNGRRILVEENLIEGNWLDGQQGYAIQLTPRSEGGACKAWCVIEDVTFRWNHIRRTGSGLNLSGRADADLQLASTRFLFEHNLWDEIDTGIYTGQGRIWILQNDGLADVTFSHNTGFGTDMTILYCHSEARIEVEDNILSSAPGYGLWSCAGKPSGTQAVSYHVQNWTYLRNVTLNVSATGQPTGNFYTSLASTSFVNSSTRNWALSATSPYKGKGENGSDPGVDYTTLMAKLSGVVVP